MNYKKEKNQYQVKESFDLAMKMFVDIQLK